MALRLIEFSLPSDQRQRVDDVLAEDPPLEVWHQQVYDGRLVVRLVLDAEHTGPAVDRIEEHFGSETDFRLIISKLEAALPRPSEQEDEESAEAEQEQSDSSGATSGVSREELYNDVWDMTAVSTVMIATTVLSAVVAAVGMMRDNVAVIIGAMVIAPLLGPNMGLALSTTLADAKLLWRAMKCNATGVAVSLFVAVMMGVVLTVDPSAGEIALRTQVSLSDIVLASAAGAAGVLALTSGVAAALVGVMVAVALLPPTVAMGLMLGSGQWGHAGGAALLLATNVICVNLAGTATFLLACGR